LSVAVADRGLHSFGREGPPVTAGDHRLGRRHPCGVQLANELGNYLQLGLLLGGERRIDAFSVTWHKRVTSARRRRFPQGGRGEAGRDRRPKDDKVHVIGGDISRTAQSLWSRPMSASADASRVARALS
jgi:hypothetical protein